MTKNVPYFITLCWSLLHRNSKPPSFASTHSRISLFSNIVGYQTVRIPQGWSIFTPTFQCTDSSKTNTLGDIIVLNAEGNEFDGVSKKQDAAWNRLHVLNGALQLRKVKAVGGDVEPAMSYVMSGSNLSKWGANSTVELFDGEGVIVNNTQGSDLYLRVAGQVNVDPLIEVQTGWSVLGNATPVDMTVGDLTVLNAEGNEFDGVSKKQDAAWNKLHVLNGALQLRKVKAVGGDVEPAMSYVMSGSNLSKWGANSTVELSAGEALVVNNTQGSKLFIMLKKPLAE